MSYIDGFVIPVPSGDRERYRAAAQKFHEKFKDCGATRQVECWGDDVPDGKLTSFPLAVKREADEAILFSWITWPSKRVRDDAWKKIMADPRMSPEKNPMPFDGKRMIYGGFQIVAEA